MPKYLNIENKNYEVKVHIQNQRIKIYAKKEMDMVNNIDLHICKYMGAV